MTDDERATAISQVYSNAKKAAENAVRAERGETIKETDAQKARMDPAKFVIASSAYDNATTPSGYNSTPNGSAPKWAQMLAVLDDKSVNNSTKLEFINAHSGRNDEFQAVDEARTYYTASGIYNSAETPEGYKATDAGNTPGWAKALAVIDSDTLTDDEKLDYINSVSGRKEAFATLDEAQTYYEKQKNKAKQ